MRAFVLSTGRCGSLTFARACGHITNYTSSHESHWGLHPAQRLDFPDDHIEVDNRLSWHLGLLGKRYPDALYIHLRRDPELVAESFLARWSWHPPHKYRNAPKGMRRLARRLERPKARPGGVIEAYAYEILGRRRSWDPQDRLDICRDYVNNINENISAFMDGRPGVVVHLENAQQDFPVAWQRLTAEGDLTRALGEFDQKYNAQRP